MKSAAHRFVPAARLALRDESLQQALGKAKPGFLAKRLRAIERFDGFERLREHGARIKAHTLEHLDSYLLQFEEQVRAQGGEVHWAKDAAEARDIVVELCRRSRASGAAQGAGPVRVAKGKTMVGEEVALNAALEAHGMEVVETDLGEYIVQLAKEPPSHIIAPAVHKTRLQISELFDDHHHGGERHGLRAASELVAEARRVLRDRFLTADVGITGANFLVAETGSMVLVTNEGNGDLCHTLARVHIAVAGIEKVVPRLEDASALLRLLTRSATGQDATCYTTLVSGPKRSGDPDGPDEFHVVLLDNGRSSMLSGPYRDMLRCIRCGACLNHCPVYSAIGGHAYGWVYPGPMGSVLTPLLVGLDGSRDLPHACTLNGRCRSVCPVDVPLPTLLRELRHQLFERRLTGARTRVGLALWGSFARRPRLYHRAAALATRLLARLGRARGRFSWLPLAGGWTAARDFPAPQGETFQQQWQRQRRRPPS